jgi:hypothetical protein
MSTDVRCTGNQTALQYTTKTPERNSPLSSTNQTCQLRQSKQNVVFKREVAELNRHESHASECFNGCKNDLTSTGKTSNNKEAT